MSMRLFGETISIETHTDPEVSVMSDCPSGTVKEEMVEPMRIQQLGRVIERPVWLPQDWGFQVKQRSSGKQADKYYISPSNDKLRSKNEVLHYLQTGTKLKRKMKTGEGEFFDDTLKTPNFLEGSFNGNQFSMKGESYGGLMILIAINNFLFFKLGILFVSNQDIEKVEFLKITLSGSLSHMRKRGIIMYRAGVLTPSS
ncbi:hypothetical protein M9H77_16714 [Catharanthus roseus]|uniref:Uncharacterized protein n=1 Tax=Catharanthus roseus TaxID=4058 RepID=A0ACC0B2K8_CATRO|nr:hypothetical protein M9H77_16714 [Catharanthus roseus]